MNGQLLDDLNSELAMDSCITLDSGLVLPVSPESGQDQPLISIPDVGEIVGTLGENYRRFYWFMVEHVEGCNV